VPIHVHKFCDLNKQEEKQKNFNIKLNDAIQAVYNKNALDVEEELVKKILYYNTE
jgi:hypothetical protein